MVRLHEGVGTLVVLAFLALTIVNLMQLRGRSIPWSRQASFGAAGLLFVQYVIGFNLLGGDHDVSPFHFLFALGAIATVGLEHGKANVIPDVAQRARLASIATAGTTALVIIAYAIGQSS
jgi:hypothetical protein